MNARLFKALDERAHTLQQQAEKARISEKEKTETITSIRKELNATIARADQTVTNLLAGKSGPIPAAHTSQLHALRENLQHLSHIIESLMASEQILIHLPSNNSAQSLESSLRPAGYEILQNRDTAAISALVRVQAPDLILIADKLADNNNGQFANGLELAARLLKVNPGLAIVIVSEERSDELAIQRKRSRPCVETPTFHARREESSMIQTLEPILATHPFFHDLDPHYLKLIVGCAANVRFEAGQFIFREGDEANQFYLIRHGSVSLEIFVPVAAPSRRKPSEKATSLVGHGFSLLISGPATHAP